MSLFVAALAAVALQPPADSGNVPVADACAPLVHADVTAPAAALDVRTTLALHNGVVRWDVERGPVRLWVQPRPVAESDANVPAGDWQRAVLDAASSWRGVVGGLAFRPVRDSADADVIVTWERELRASTGGSGLAWRTAGQTTLAPSDDGRAAAAHVRLAIAAPTGARYGLDDTRAVARHELGHALGLAHHAAANSVMAPLVRVDRLSADDRAALRLLYALPVGARCTAPSAEAVSPVR
jgi:hypothetical protein